MLRYVKLGRKNINRKSHSPIAALHSASSKRRGGERSRKEGLGSLSGCEGEREGGRIESIGRILKIDLSQFDKKEEEEEVGDSLIRGLFLLLHEERSKQVTGTLQI